MAERWMGAPIASRRFTITSIGQEITHLPRIILDRANVVAEPPRDQLGAIHISQAELSVGTADDLVGFGFLRGHLKH